MKPAVIYPDVERLTRDLLEELVADHEAGVDVGVGVPTDWTGAEYLQVSCDGTPNLDHPIVARPTVRITAWSRSTTRSKELASLAFGLLCAYAGGNGISSIQPLTGVLPARDPDERAELASVTVRVSTRSIPIETGS